MKIIKGDLIKLALQREFDVIAHGCNCQCRQKSGIAKQMVEVFQTNNSDYYWAENVECRGDINKLGTIDYAEHYLDSDQIISRGESYLYIGMLSEHKYVKSLFEANNDLLIVVNAYTQFEPGINSLFPGEPPINYAAMELCFTKMNYLFAGLRIGLPYLIGCGLARGDENTVLNIIKKCFINVDLTLVRL